MGAHGGYDDPAAFGVKEPEDMFASHHYTVVRGDGRDMRALPLWCYTSERFHRAEMERIFLPGWNMLEREERVPEAGDYHCLTFFGVPLLIVRAKDNKVRVFANTCRHRGALVAEGSGNCKAFRCPYHFWTFGLDGRFNGAPNYNDADGKALIEADNREEFDLLEIESGDLGWIHLRASQGGRRDSRAAPGHIRGDARLTPARGHGDRPQGRLRNGCQLEVLRRKLHRRLPHPLRAQKFSLALEVRRLRAVRVPRRGTRGSCQARR